MDPAAGSAKLDPVFDSTNFALDYLTKPNFLSDAGINIGERIGGADIDSICGVHRPSCNCESINIA